jgi:hypothetical protein
MQHLRTIIRQAACSDPRLALAAVVRLEHDLDWLRQRAVRLARQEGYDWGRIGRLLDRSRQSVRERYAALEQAGWPMLDPLPPHARNLGWAEVETNRFAELQADIRRRRAFASEDEVVPW